MRRSSSKARSAASLANSLHRDLSLYALAAGAAGVSVLALAQPSEAEIVYTKAHHTLNRYEQFALDLNRDGLPDFTIRNLFHTGTFDGRHYSSTFRLVVAPKPGNLVQDESFSSLAAALPRGAAIGASQRANYRAVNMAYKTSHTFIGGYSGGYWLNVSNRYLGLHFKINGEWHYGWARLNVYWNHRWIITAELTGFAYETEASKTILAGDTGSSTAGNLDLGPIGEIFSTPRVEARPAVPLGALALGASGLTIWRRNEEVLVDNSESNSGKRQL